MDILMVSSEMLPFAKTGGLADVVGSLPLALADLGQKVSAVMPLYRGIEEKFKPEKTGIRFAITILEGETPVAHECEVLYYNLEGEVDVYFIKHDPYFDRETLYNLPTGDYHDNCARFTLFNRAVIELMRLKNWRPDVIHCHDWQAALTPIYLKTILKDDPQIGSIPVLFTIHNLGYMGLFWKMDIKQIGLGWEYFTSDKLEYWDGLNLLKGGIVYADKITTVSQAYAREIQTPELGRGLDGVLRGRAKDFQGILNGIDYRVWDPATDKHIAANYTVKDLSGKKSCKAALQKELELADRPDVPIVAMISRLADQKGFDLVATIIEDMMSMDLQFVVLGSGEQKYHYLLDSIARRHPERTGIRITFDEGLAHRIEAGADIFVMPSAYEPCGLNQMISLKYGAIPVVRATGGLDDTVENWDPKTGKGNGFKFHDYSGMALLESLKAALSAYGRPREWKRLVTRAMKEDHSWSAAAKQYMAVYQDLIK